MSGFAVLSIYVKRRGYVARESGVDGQRAPVGGVIAAKLYRKRGIRVQGNCAVKDEKRLVLPHGDGTRAVNDHVRDRDLARTAVRLLLQDQKAAGCQRERTSAEHEVRNGLRRTQLLRRINDEVGVLEVGNGDGGRRPLRRAPAYLRAYVAHERRIRRRVGTYLVVRRGERREYRACRYCRRRDDGSPCLFSHVHVCCLSFSC